MGVCRSGSVFFLNDEPEVAAVCIYPAGRGFSSRAAGRGRLCWREGGRMSDGEASLTLQQEFSLLQLPAPQHTERAGERKRTGPVDITAMTYSDYRVDCTLDFSAWS